MKVRLRNPDRVVEVSGPSTVAGVLEELQIVPEAVLVIRNATLLTRDERVAEEDEIEIRPILSGGAPKTTGRSLVASSRIATIHDQRSAGRSS